jgi:competence protein ComFC
MKFIFKYNKAGTNKVLAFMFATLAKSRLARWTGLLAGGVASILFPSSCRICEQELVTASRVPICENCLSSFARIAGPHCERCGQPWNDTDQYDLVPLQCENCSSHKFHFAQVRSLGPYEGALVRAILLIKYERLEPLGHWFARRLAECVQSDVALREANIVVPVPLHTLRKKERGFNQVDLFAKPLARLLNLPYRPILLMRTRPRPEKHLLTHDERWDAVRGAFAMQSGGRVDNLSILLLDDVMTTGATLDACAGALRDAGATSVLGLTLARAVSPANPLFSEPYRKGAR